MVGKVVRAQGYGCTIEQAAVGVAKVQSSPGI